VDRLLLTFNYSLRISFIFIFFIGQTFAEETEEFSFYLSEDLFVITPTRLDQSIKDSPTPVTIITKEDIIKSGKRSIVEALQLVPGMVVAFTSGNEYRVGFHGTNGILPRRLNVLVDGVSVYRNSVARVDWETLPNIEEVQKIEVIRSSGGATYGTNSPMAVVNVITKHPKDNQNNNVSTYIGSRGNVYNYVKYANNVDDYSFYTSLRNSKTDGFDNLNNSAFSAPNLNHGNDFIDQTQFNLRLNKNYSDLELDTTLNLVDKKKGTLQQDSNGIFPSDEVGIDIFYTLQLKYDFSESHTLETKLNYVSNENDNDFSACFQGLLLTPELRELFILNPTLARTFSSGIIPSGTTPEEIALINDVVSRINSMGASASQFNCGNVSIDIKDTRTDFTVNDTYVFNDTLRMVTGFNVSVIEYQSDYHLNGSIINNRYSIYNNTEYKPIDSITINVGILGEVEENYLEEDIFWSPRVALNYHINKQSTLRFALNRSYRTPDLYERESDWNIQLTNLSPAVLGSTTALHYFAVAGNPNLKPEKFESKEINLYSKTADSKWLIDLKIYQEKLTDVISSGLSPIFTDPTNDDAVTLEGFDLNVQYRQSSRLLFNFGYAYQDSEATNVAEEILHSDNAGFLNVIKTFEDNQGSLAYTAYATSNLSGNRYVTSEIALTKPFYKTAKVAIDGHFLVRHQRDNDIDVISSNFTYNWSNTSHYYLMGGIKVTF